MFRVSSRLPPSLPGAHSIACTFTHVQEEKSPSDPGSRLKKIHTDANCIPTVNMDSYTLGCVSFHHRGKLSFHTMIKCRPFRSFVHGPHFILLGGKSLIGNGEGGGVDERRRPISKYFVSCQCGIEKGVWLRQLAAFAFSTSGLQT